MRETRRPAANSITGAEIKFRRCFVRFAWRGKKKKRREKEKGEKPRSLVEFRAPFRAVANNAKLLRKKEERKKLQSSHNLWDDTGGGGSVCILHVI